MAHVVTPTGPLGFQVSVAGLPEGRTGLIADFGTLAEAEAFATLMRQIDNGLTYSMAPKEPC